MLIFYQAKGPKGQKLALDTKIVDPHDPIEVIDPVFSDSVQVSNILPFSNSSFQLPMFIIRYTQVLLEALTNQRLAQRFSFQIFMCI